MTNFTPDSPTPLPPSAVAPSEARPAQPVLSYATPPPSGGTVVAARCANGAEAEMLAGELASAGIRAQVIDYHTEMLGPYIGGADVKVLVLKEDAERAGEVLRLATSEEVEPAGEPADGVPEATRLGEEGRPAHLVMVAAFDSPRLLREAATLLAVGRVQAFLPTLVPRGDRPAGEGKRFLLRVREEDLDRAGDLLREAEEEAGDEDEPRCPRCKSWRVFPVTSLWGGITRLFGMGPAEEVECLACRYRGSKPDFAARGIRGGNQRTSRARQ